MASRAARGRAYTAQLQSSAGSLGALTEADVDAALREVRRALLEADVALDVARAFADKVKEHAVGVAVIKSVTPG